MIRGILACVAFASVVLGQTNAKIFHFIDYQAYAAERVTDINPGAGHSLFGISPIKHFDKIAWNGAVYFRAGPSPASSQLWRTDGTTTTQISAPSKSFYGNPHSFVVHENTLYFAALGQDQKEHLYRYDGAGISKVATLPASVPPWPEFGGVISLTSFGGKLYFSVAQTNSVYRAWRLDGSNVGEVTSINQAIGSGAALTLGQGPFVAFNDHMYFIVKSADDRCQLWSFDGAETNLVVSMHDAGDNQRCYGTTTVHNNALYYGATARGVESRTLWRIGASGSTTKVGDLAPQDGYLPQAGLYFASAQNSLYISWDGMLFVYNGSTITKLTSTPGFFAGQARHISPYSSKTQKRIYIAAGAHFSWLEPHLVKGSQLMLVAEVKPDVFEDLSQEPPWEGYPGSMPSAAVQLGDAVYFSANDGEHGRELWRIKPKTKVGGYLELIPIWDDPISWVHPSKNNPYTVAVYAISEKEQPRLVARRRVTVDAKLAARRSLVFEFDGESPRLPVGFALQFLVFGGKSDALLEDSLLTFETDARQKARLERMAADNRRLASKKAAEAAPIENIEMPVAPAARPRQ